MTSKHFGKAELFQLTNEGIPPELAERMIIPEHIRVNGHVLNPYVQKELIPRDLDLILVEDLNRFFHQLTENNFHFTSNCRGLYVAQDHIWIPDGNYQRTNKALQQEYGLSVTRALLLPERRIDYWTMIHEALHDVFNNLPSEKRTQLVQAVTAVYNTNGKLHNLLDLTHLNVSNFDWDIEEIAKKMEENRLSRRHISVGVDELFVFQKLKPSDQLQVVDEFIANFFATDRGNDRWSSRYLHPSFRVTLREVGYNVDTPPEVMP